MPSALPDKLRSIVGAPHVLTGVDCSPYVVEGRAPEAAVFPGTKEEIAAVLVAAGEAGLPVTPWGGGTKMAIGSPPNRIGLVLGLKRLDRILEHEPGDLTVTVEAGLPFETLQAELGKRGQWLSLDAGASVRATVGGMLASDASGPRRHLYGTARDLVIGLTVVMADGSLVRGGGKVVKNVAGYDLPKLYIGSFGTLGVLVEATLKLRPRVDVDRLVVARFDRLKAAGAAARAVLGSDLIPSALELADGEALRRLGLGGAAALLVGLDGLAEQVDWEVTEIQRLLGPIGLGETTALDGAARDDTWRALAGLGRPGHERVAAVMKWAVLPTQIAELMEGGAAAAQRNGLVGAFTAHAGVGIVTAVLAGGTNPNAVVSTLTEWRALVNRVDGHAMIEWAPLAVKERVAVWDAAGPTLRLMKGIKERLDPRGILNPGRFVEASEPMAHPPVTETKSAAPLTLHGLNVDGVDRCVHCGLCLAYCPTFSELGTEMDSPRGRIMLIKSLAEGRINLTDSTVAHLDLCLGCRACETVCPAGVPYGQLIEAARAEIERQRPGGLLRRGFRWINFSLLLPNPSLLRLAAAGLRFYQASGLRRLVRASGLLRFLPEPLRHWEPLLPDLPSGVDRAPLAEVTPATGVRRVRVGLLTGCIQQVAFGPQNQATARVLSRNGAEVIAPRAQACCGALHAHAGEHETALALARRTIETFEAAGVEHVVVNTSGCGAHMKAYGTLLADDPAWRGRAARFAAGVRDVSEFLAAEPLRGPLREVKRTVTYHDPCHVVHGQKIRAQPRALLAQIPGLRVVELAEADWCCGSAGTYNLTQPEMATRLQERKIAHVRATGADAVVTANPGCIIQIVQGLRAKSSPIQVLHIVELLDQAYRGT